MLNRPPRPCCCDDDQGAEVGPLLVIGAMYAWRSFRVKLTGIDTTTKEASIESALGEPGKCQLSELEPLNE